MSTGNAALPPAVPVAEFRGTAIDRMCQAGLGAGALASLLVVFAGLGDDRVIVRQQGVPLIASRDSLISLGVIFAVALIICAVLPWAAARFTGIGLLGIAAATFGLIVAFGRSLDRFSVGVPYEFGTAGRWLAIAYGVACAGLILALIGSPRIGRRPPNNAGASTSGTSGYSITGFVLSLCGLLTGVITAPLGIAFSIAGLDDHKKSVGARGGKGLAVAGLVIGIILVAFATLFVAIAMAAGEPTDDNTFGGLHSLAALIRLI